MKKYMTMHLVKHCGASSFVTWCLVTVVLVLLPRVHAQSNAPALSELRRQCQLATQSMDGAEAMQSLLQSVSDSEPLALGYKAMAEFLIAHHSYNPITKVRCFSRGRDMLERAVAVAHYSVELRYLRMAIQTRLPSLLGYNDNISEDKKFLMDFVLDRDNSQRDPQLSANIRVFLIDCSACNDAEKEQIRSLR